MAHSHWFTKEREAAMFRAALGGVIDLDPSGARPDLDEVKADRTYLWPADDGLELPWFGHVYANPPYSREGIRAFADKALAEEPHLLSLLMLVPLRPSARWWRDLARRAECCIILGKRIAFTDGSDNPRKATTGRGELCVFGWRLAKPEAVGGIVIRGIMREAPALERSVQRSLGELDARLLGERHQPC